MKRSREPEEQDFPGPTSLAIASSEDEAASPPAAKITELDPASATKSGVEMRCSLPPHKEPLMFPSYDEYEAHYHMTHSNRCLECRKNLPSAHLLGVHIEETHDSFALVKRERGERTVCLVLLGQVLWLPPARLLTHSGSIHAL